jgi:hypothetical protein
VVDEFSQIRWKASIRAYVLVLRSGTYGEGGCMTSELCCCRDLTAWVCGTTLETKREGCG